MHCKGLSKTQGFLKLLSLDKMSCLFFFFFFSVFNLGAIQYSIFVLSVVYMVLKEFMEEEIFPFHKILPFNTMPVYITQK